MFGKKSAPVQRIETPPSSTFQFADSVQFTQCYVAQDRIKHGDATQDDIEIVLGCIPDTARRDHWRKVYEAVLHRWDATLAESDALFAEMDEPDKAR